MEKSLRHKNILSEKISIRQGDPDINQVIVLSKDEEIRSKIIYEYTQPDTTTKINFKVVARDNAIFEFYPVVRILKGAKNTNTNLSIKCLLIGDDAKIIVEPSMEIEDDDVKAGHGASIGSIDKDQIEYLKSRGVDATKAEEILVKAFLSS